MQATDNGRAILRRAFKRLEHEVPAQAAVYLRRLRHPEARWIRIPLGLLLVLGGIFSILPVLGIWMLPLGLLLIAYDVPLLREPTARFTLWGIKKWVLLRERLFGKEDDPAPRQHGQPVSLSGEVDAGSPQKVPPDRN